MLLDYHLSEAGLAAGDVQHIHAARTETDAALAVLQGQADTTFGLLSVAQQYRLEFVPIVRERFDLLVWRSEWFEEPFQKFLEFCRSPAYQEKVDTLKGYDASGLGRVHLNVK